MHSRVSRVIATHRAAAAAHTRLLNVAETLLKCLLQRSRRANLDQPGSQGCTAHGTRWLSAGSALVSRPFSDAIAAECVPAVCCDWVVEFAQADRARARAVRAPSAGALHAGAERGLEEAPAAERARRLRPARRRGLLPALRTEVPGPAGRGGRGGGDGARGQPGPERLLDGQPTPKKFPTVAIRALRTAGPRPALRQL